MKDSDPFDYISRLSRKPPGEAALRNTCPWCGTTFQRPLSPGLYVHTGRDVTMEHSTTEIYFGEKGELAGHLYAYICPKCARHVIDVQLGPLDDDSQRSLIHVLPLGEERPVPPEVPSEIASDYREATRIAALSTKGAATLARRALQATLRQGFPALPHGDLFKEVEWAINQGMIDHDLGDALHSLRKAGNFGAHPEKDGAAFIYDLAPDDLEACFMILEVLFENLFVKPKRLATKMAALKAKVSKPTK